MPQPLGRGSGAFEGSDSDLAFAHRRQPKDGTQHLSPARADEPGNPQNLTATKLEASRANPRGGQFIQFENRLADRMRGREGTFR